MRGKLCAVEVLFPIAVGNEKLQDIGNRSGYQHDIRREVQARTRGEENDAAGGGGCAEDQPTHDPPIGEWDFFSPHKRGIPKARGVLWHRCQRSFDRGGSLCRCGICAIRLPRQEASAGADRRDVLSARL